MILLVFIFGKEKSIKRKILVDVEATRLHPMVQF